LLAVAFPDSIRYLFLFISTYRESFSLRKYVKFILLFLFAIFLLWLFGRNLDWAEVGASVREANAVYLAAAVLIICVGYLLRAIRWSVLLQPITKSTIRDLFATTTVGFAAIFLIGRAGEIVRPMWLPMRDHRVRPSAAVVTIAVERVFDLASLIAFFSVSLIWFNAPAGRESEFAYIKLVGNVMLACCLAGIVALVIYQRTSPKIIAWFTRITDGRWIPGRLRYIFLSLLRQLAKSLEILKDWREIFWASFWTIGLWLAIAIPTWLVLLAFGLQLKFVDSIFVMGVASMGSLVPTPGGAAGAFHAATAGALILLGVDREQAAAVSIVMHLVYFAPAIVFGLYYFLHGDISIERFRSLMSSENAEREIESDSPDFEPVS
jgi:uncharacterized protein (TIRG00374 family)